jgi:PAS domain S-box-containing protein
MDATVPKLDISSRHHDKSVAHQVSLFVGRLFCFYVLFVLFHSFLEDSALLLTDRDIRTKIKQSSYANETHFRYLWEMSSDAMALSDPEGIVLDANPAYLRLYGYTSEQVIGKSLALIFPEEKRAWALRQYKNIFTNDSPPPPFEAVVRCANGSKRIVESRASFLTTAGQRMALLSTIRDITEQKQAEATAAYLETIVQSAGDAILDLSMEGLIQSWNPAAERLLGYSAAEAIGQSISLIFVPETYPKAEEMIALLQAGQVVQSETVSLSKEGKFVDVCIYMAPVTDRAGTLIGISTTLTDTRHYKQAQLAELHRGLLQGQEKERQHLASEIHDGPLQELVGLSFELTALRYALTDEHQQTHVAAIVARLEQTGRHLRHVAMTLRPPVLIFGLVPAIRQCIEEFRHQHPDQVVELTLDGESTTIPEATTLALYRICGQSLDNIARHAHATHVWVRLRAKPTQIVLEIEDNGNGFVVPDSWTEFIRQHHLGVADMSERAHALGGRLAVDSQPGRGTRVIVTVPLPHPYSVTCSST